MPLYQTINQIGQCAVYCCTFSVITLTMNVLKSKSLGHMKNCSAIIPSNSFILKKKKNAIHLQCEMFKCWDTNCQNRQTNRQEASDWPVTYILRLQLIAGNHYTNTPQQLLSIFSHTSATPIYEYVLVDFRCYSLHSSPVYCNHITQLYTTLYTCNAIPIYCASTSECFLFNWLFVMVAPML